MGKGSTQAPLRRNPFREVTVGAVYQHLRPPLPPAADATVLWQDLDPDAEFSAYVRQVLLDSLIHKKRWDQATPAHRDLIKRVAEGMQHIAMALVFSLQSPTGDVPNQEIVPRAQKLLAEFDVWINSDPKNGGFVDVGDRFLKWALCKSAKPELVSLLKHWKSDAEASNRGFDDDKKVDALVAQVNSVLLYWQLKPNFERGRVAKLGVASPESVALDILQRASSLSPDVLRRGKFELKKHNR